jgi:hypothetical protein
MIREKLDFVKLRLIFIIMKIVSKEKVSGSQYTILCRRPKEAARKPKSFNN